MVKWAPEAKQIHRFSEQTQKILCAAAAALGAVRAEAACDYSLTIIQAPDCAISPSPTFGHGISESAQVVGGYTVCSIGTGEAFVWDGQMVTLQRPPGVDGAGAWDINEAGLMIGQMVVSGIGDRAFVHDGSQFIDLGTLPGGNLSRGRAINSKGQVVGVWGGPGDAPSLGAFLWQDGVMTDLNADLGTENSMALAINDRGQVTGWMGMSQVNGAQAFIWHEGKVKALGHLPGGTFSAGHAINDVGQVVGTERIGPSPGVARRPFLWSDGEMIDLGLLPGFEQSSAGGINDLGQIVGVAWGVDGNPNIEAAFIWQNGIMTDLNELIPPDTGITLTVARAINDAGQITGWADDPDLNVVAFLLTPINRPLGDLDIDCRVGIWDLFILFEEWGKAESPGDLNDDGTVDSYDLAILFDNWKP